MLANPVERARGEASTAEADDSVYKGLMKCTNYIKNHLL
jgi:hypothetical protein